MSALPVSDEASVRRLAIRNDLLLEKCRSRDPFDPAYGLYRLRNPRLNLPLGGSEAWSTLEDLATYLTA
jgi:hypothetical protein